MSSSFTQFNTNLNSTSGMVNIYVRNYKKHAVVLPVKSQMTGQELHEKIKNKYLSKVSDFVLYFKGKVVPANQTQVILDQKSILHLVDLSRVKTATINLTFKTNTKPSNYVQAQVTPKTLIRDVLRQNIKPVIGKGQTEVFLVYLGKPINIFKTFEEEIVEDGSEILIIEFKKGVPATQKLNQTQISTTEGMQKAELKQTIKLNSPAMGQRKQIDYSMNQMKKKASISQSSIFDGFNPHLNAGPGAAPGGSPLIQQKIYEGNLKENETAPPQNPEKGGGPTTKIGDTIFSAEDQLPETENLTSQAAKQLKASWGKGKGKENSQEDK